MMNKLEEIEMKRMQKKILVLTIASFFLIISGCRSKGNVKEMSINLGNRNQESISQGFYYFKQGKLEITKKYLDPFNPNSAEGSEQQEEVQKRSQELFLAEFPKEEMTPEILSEGYQTTLKKISLTETDQSLIFDGKDYHWEFKFMGESKSRVTDQFGVEYELHR